MNFEKGDIFLNKDSGQHPIIFIEWIEKFETFKGYIISSMKVGSNLLMEDDHFCKEDDLGKKYTIVNKPSYLIIDHAFKKKMEWLKDVNKSGKLTELGIEFVEKYEKDIEPLYSNKHIRDIKE